MVNFDHLRHKNVLQKLTRPPNCHVRSKLPHWHPSRTTIFRGLLTLCTCIIINIKNANENVCIQRLWILAKVCVFDGLTQRQPTTMSDLNSHMLPTHRLPPTTMANVHRLLLPYTHTRSIVYKTRWKSCWNEWLRVGTIQQRHQIINLTNKFPRANAQNLFIHFLFVCCWIILI